MFLLKVYGVSIIPTLALIYTLNLIQHSHKVQQLRTLFDGDDDEGKDEDDDDDDDDDEIIFHTGSDSKN